MYSNCEFMVWSIGSIFPSGEARSGRGFVACTCALPLSCFIDVYFLIPICEGLGRQIPHMHDST